jgi:hypothetical protein
MTIKQQGGIFGRNPTFNDVNVEGSITVPNDSITGNAIQGGTLTVDVLGVGTTSPDSALEISSSSANEPIVKIATAHPSGTNGRLEFETNWSGNIAVKASVEGSSENATNGNLVFKTQQSGSLTEAARFNSSGNLVFPSGKGIDFSATSGTGTSELFDDYEEGTWTPVISDANSGGNLGSASIGQALYTKIGRTVFLSANLTNITTAGMTAGNLLFIQGLPFTSSASNFAVGNVSTDTVAFNTRVYPFCQIGTSSSVLSFAASGTGSTRSNIIVSNITSGTSDIALTITYNT